MTREGEEEPQEVLLEAEEELPDGPMSPKIRIALPHPGELSCVLTKTMSGTRQPGPLPTQWLPAAGSASGPQSW